MTRPTTSTRSSRSPGTICEFHRFILDRAEDYRRSPADNMLSDLVRARDADGRALDDRELASIVLIILVAGNDTTTATLSTGMLPPDHHAGAGR